MIRNGKVRRAGRMALGGWLLLALAACQPFWNTPETRARDFIEALIAAPAETRALRDLANLAPEQDPGTLVDGLSARVGLDFLRARHAQGVKLKYVTGATRQTDEANYTVTIRVTYLQPGTPATDEVRFQVRIEKDAGGRWRIARVTGDN